MIIGITGKVGSGKSTIGAYITEKYGYTEYNMADPLKKIGEIFGFSKESLYGNQEDKLKVDSRWGISGRNFLQKVGTELFREKLKEVLPEMKIENTVWTQIFKNKYLSEPKLYVIPDVRFLDEAETIKKLGGIIIRTKREYNGFDKDSVHKSEIELDRIECDYVVYSDGNVFSEIDRIIERELKGREKIEK